MAKRKQRRLPSRDAATVNYTDADGNVLTLRESLSRGTIRKIESGAAKGATSQEDIWHRRMELCFERLTVNWEIAGLPLDDQAMLLGRYRMADIDEKRWVQETISEHLRRFIPELVER